MQQQKAETKTEKNAERDLFFFFVFFKSKIRVCGGGRYGRADMIQRGQHDVM